MTAPLPSSPRPQQSTATMTPLSSRSLPRAVQTSAALHDMLCSWVPGTTNIVRLKISAERGGERMLEVTSTHLGRIFGKEAVHDLYLKGRAKLKVTAQQIALLT
ncbi:hypothetical protein [Deinococcus humi]|uniref:Uncharacterized protein n=1 Tax=Deinococcus humi TaxID=662880 RepID=A0A7W8NHH5_9DEIO|nr:hypothetical protein [Deinococcus humi]MBB5364798.1 hypothetical protein [Deinococcus humi]GGO34113.1 hypothetical protein GCM10008949_34390 [Deinococcus humi]